jgi:hypothetical protein
MGNPSSTLNSTRKRSVICTCSPCRAEKIDELAAN